MWLALAKEWGVTPWALEADAPAVWVDRWLAVTNMQAEKVERDRKHAQGGKGRRLI